jgi:hypothetical protein
VTSLSSPGWHQIVAAAAGHGLDTSLRPDDVSMKTTDHGHGDQLTVDNVGLW